MTWHLLAAIANQLKILNQAESTRWCMIKFLGGGGGVVDGEGGSMKDA